MAHLSDMATCSSIADPVFVFQFPEIDVLLPNKGNWSSTLSEIDQAAQVIKAIEL